MAGTTVNTAGKLEEITVRQTKVLELRIAGLSTRAIAKQVQVSQTTVVTDLRAMLDQNHEEQKELTDRMRNMEDERLDALLSIAMTSALRGDMDAVKTALQISKRRSVLWGLDAPKGIDITSQGQAVKGYIGFSPEEWDALNKPQGGTSDQQSDVEDAQLDNSASGTSSV